MTPADVANLEIGELNLRLAVDIPGSKDLDIKALLHQLYQWTDQVRDFTEKMRRRFQARPEDFNNSRANFNLTCLTTYVQRDLGVLYRPELMEGEYDARDSRSLFIHGPLTGYGGTCINLPVLYIALGRGLGYPLYLVHAIEHSFVRWRDASEALNFEATSKGFVSHEDEYYHHWLKTVIRIIRSQDERVLRVDIEHVAHAVFVVLQGPAGRTDIDRIIVLDQFVGY